MPVRQELSRLSRLTDESLRSFTYLREEFAFFTRETEKKLLIALSQVLKKIQLWTHEHDCDCNSDSGTVAKVPSCNSECSGDSMSHYDDRDCLAKIIGDLIILISIESQFVQQLAGNILVAISDYIVSHGSNWDDYMQSLCICLKLAISYALLHTLEQSTLEQLCSNYEASTIIIALEGKLENANWASVACVIRVLRNILKRLKQDFDDQLLEVYFTSISSCLADIPWDSIDKLHVGLSVKTLRTSTGDKVYSNAGTPEFRNIFLGTLIQFFCSLVDQSGWMEADGGSLDMNPVICEISNLIPRLLAWCLGGGDRNMCLSEYFTHKMLMLMIRLSYRSHLECPLLVSWLQLVHVYFEDLVLLPITNLEVSQDILEGSPFLVSVADARIQDMTSSHSQRLAVFLFLRCCVSLVDLRAGTSMNSDINSDFLCCIRKKGLSELYCWLQKHIPSEMFMGCESYSQRCTIFSLAFLRLFVCEDDILFKVLLQLISVHFCFKKDALQDACASPEAESMLFHISNLFNPVHLFHLFLAELHYDHQVLLDYLISKDMGASSAEYLLRSLRVVCDSWHVFVDFVLEVEVANVKDLFESSRKRKKSLVDAPDLQGHQTSSSLKSNRIQLSRGKQYQKDLSDVAKHYRTSSSLPFENAKNCLLSLKKSMQKLHRKNLFPYNPEALLRRLMTFEELCHKK